MNRVVVSGVGVTAPMGLDPEMFWQTVTTGRDIFAPAAAAPSANFRVGAIAPDLSFADLPLPSIAACDRSALLAVRAAGMALMDAGLPLKPDRPARVAVIIGNGGGGMASIEAQYRRLFIENKRPHPLTVVQGMTSSCASMISIAYGAQGPAFVTSSACASASHAIGLAAQFVRSGLVDIAIAGGAEAPLSQGSLVAWEAMKIVSRTRCRPFSLNRDGLMLAEGAAIAILQAEGHARSRGRTPRVELAGYAASADAGDIMAPSAEGMARAMRAAIADAGIDPAEIAYVNAHGTGTRANDRTEARALGLVFGDSRIPPVSSIKGVTGHSLGAAGALEAVACVLAIAKSVAPPTANFERRDPECDLDVIPNAPRAMTIDAALSNSFAFGGLNASLVFRKIA